MIVYLHTRLARYTVGRSLKNFPDDLRYRVRLWTYASVLKARELPVATYIFSDVERMSPQTRVAAARLWLALERSGRPVRLLNHPIRAMGRFELLRNLHERGINDFNAYPAQRLPAEMRFPVFVRTVHEHEGPLTDLIHDREMLVTEIARLRAAGIPIGKCLVVEFCDTADANGIYRKHDAFIGNGRVIPTDVYFSSHWSVKWSTNRVFSGSAPDMSALAREEIAYVRGTSYDEQLLKAVASTHIDYGRVDFAVLGDRIQIWEINTNPDLYLNFILTPETFSTPYGRDVLPRICDGIFGLFRSLDSVPEEDEPISIAPAEMAEVS